ncbi:MAG: polysaccharide deacetylase family protein [Cytophagaceae bacterium]
MNIKRTFFSLAGIAAPLVPLNLYAAITSLKLIMPTYHLIDDEENVPHVNRLYPVRNRKFFLRDIEFFSQFNFLSLQDIIKIAKGEKKIDKPSVFISFDDGFRQVHDVVAPILIQKGIPATVFLNSSTLDNKDLMFRNKASLIMNLISGRDFSIKEFNEKSGMRMESKSDLSSFVRSIRYFQKEKLDEIARFAGVDFNDFLKSYRPYLNSEQVRNLLTSGFDIGAHSIDHPLYSEIPLEEQVRQTTTNINFLKEKFGINSCSFAFPFTDNGVQNSFFRYFYHENCGLLDVSFAGAGLKKDPCRFHFQRIPMEKSLSSASRIISSEYLYYIAKSVFNKNTIKRK